MPVYEKFSSLRYLAVMIGFMIIIVFPTNAQDLGITPIILENAPQVTLMATYSHVYPPVIATSPDSRWLAIGRNTKISSGGGGDGIPPYRPPSDYHQVDSVVIFDLKNLIADPVILRGHDLFVHQMAFTENNLFILTEDNDGNQLLISWTIDGDTFTDTSVVIEDIDTAFAINADNTSIVYFHEGAIMHYDWNGQLNQLGEFNFSGPFVLDNPLSLTIGIGYRDEEIIVAMDQAEAVVLTNLDALPANIQIERHPLIRNGIGTPVFKDGTRLYADEIELYADLEVATPTLLTTEPNTTLIDFAINPEQDVFAGIVTDGTGTKLTLWDISREWFPNMLPTSEPFLSIPRDNLEKVLFSADGTKIITVAGFEIALWSVPDNLLTPNGAYFLSQNNVLAYCDNTEETPKLYKQGTRLSVVWSWYASDEVLLTDHLHNARYDVRIDASPLYHWTFVTQFRRDPEHDNNPTVYFYVPIGGVLAAGADGYNRYLRGIHHITYDLSWRNSISDGFDSFGPGSEIETNTGECFVEILE